MDRRLSGSAERPRPKRRGARRATFIGLVAAVALLHAEAAREVAADLIDFDAATAMPQRMTVAYVRTLAPEAPPAVAPKRPAAQRTTHRSARPAIAVAQAASAPSQETHADVAAVVAAEPPPPPALLPNDATQVASAEARPTTRVPAPADAASAPAAAFEWPASTRVSYVLTGNFRGEVSGQAQVEWIHAGDRYQVNLDLVVGPEFAPLITRRMTSDGTIGASGLVPDRYDQDTHVVFRDRSRVSVRFEPDAIVLANGERRVRPAGVQDTASQFVQLTYLFTTQPELLRVGNSIDVPLALPRNTDHWIYDVHDQATLATPFGPLDTFHLVPRRPNRAPGELTAEIWFAPTLRYLPVRIRIEQDPGTFIDLMIAREPEIAAS